MEEIKQKYKAEFSATEEEVADEEAEFLATVGDKFNSAFSKSAALPDPNSGLAAETKKLAVNEPAAHAAKFEGLT